MDSAASVTVPHDLLSAIEPPKRKGRGVGGGVERGRFAGAANPMWRGGKQDARALGAYKSTNYEKNERIEQLAGEVVTLKQAVVVLFALVCARMSKNG